MIKKSCGELFEIAPVESTPIPKLNLKFAKKKRFEGDLGYGIYFFSFATKLLYVGSYCGLKGGVAKERWWTHLSSITSRFKEINFLKQDTPSLAQMHRADGLEAISQSLNTQKNNFENNYATVFRNDNFRSDIYEPVLQIRPNDERFVLNHLIGNGSCMTYPRRLKVANEYWAEFRELTPNDIYNQFSFSYIRIEPLAQEFPSLSRFLYESNEDINFKKRFVRRFIENHVIDRLDPPANTRENPLDEKVLPCELIEEGAKFIDYCVESSIAIHEA